MKYSDANAFRKSKLSLVGTVDDKGFMVDDIIIVPTDTHKRDEFFKVYRIHFDAEQSILPFINEDVEVWAVSTKYVKETNILFYNVLTDNKD